MIKILDICSGISKNGNPYYSVAYRSEWVMHDGTKKCMLNVAFGSERLLELKPGQTIKTFYYNNTGKNIVGWEV